MPFQPKKQLAILGIALGMIVMGMIWSLVNTSLASIQKDLFASVLQLQWMMNCFGIFQCVPLLIMGKLGDAYGRKKLFLCGLAVAFIASVMGGLASKIEFLISCMGLFGVAGSMILPLSQALLVHQYPEHQKGKAVALWSIFASLSLACGPIVSGLILHWMDWHWIYWIEVPLIAMAMITVYFFVDKETKFHKPHCDWIGVGFLAIIVGALVIAIMQGPSWGWTSPAILALFTSTLISLILFVVLEKKTKQPLFRPDLFSNRSFLFSAIPNGCTIGFLWVSVFIIPLYLQNMLQFSPLKTGFCLLLITLPVFFFSVTVSRWYEKWGAKPLMLLGYALFLIGFFLQAFMTPNFWSLGVGFLAIGLGWVLTWGPSISNSLSSIPHHIAGIASGMFTTIQELGAILSLAIASVFFGTAQQAFLQSHMDFILFNFNTLNPEIQLDAVLTNPAAVELLLGPDTPILPLINHAFMSGYEATFKFLLGSCMVGILLTNLLPKLKKSHA
ncbi:MAG: MFS transporter [Chlamydiae bacterium]|nr:MFS transporter [Chlamydiota bacterium]